MLALCLLPGQRTVIHSYNGQLGWATVVQGELCAVTTCSCDRSPEKDAVEDRNGARAGRTVEVELDDWASCQADGSVAVVDRRQTTHQIENLEQSPAGSASLQVQSKPIDSCCLFDEATRCCERHSLQYYRVSGMILAAGPQSSQPMVETAA